ncbi:MAG: hypothetical protein O7G84_02020 [Gammaproteobacteria bacterium]|nr:hypothetical protein [Gammaproteobacteria bacterium]
MNDVLRVFSYLVAVLWLTGCASMISLKDVDGSGTVDRSLTQKQVKEAIEEGAEKVGWITKEGKDDKILASYWIRSHLVAVEITYSADSYDIQYKSSSRMKAFCSEADKQAARNIILTGQQTCPGYADPLYIHGNYGVWINELKQSIEYSLAFGS